MRNQDPLVFNRVFVVYSKDSGLTEKDFEENFKHIGAISDIHLMKDKATGRHKGICYIRFEKTSEACVACETMNGQMIPGNPRRIRVHTAQDKKEMLEIDVAEDDMLHRLFIKHPREEDEDDLREYFSEWGNVTWMYVLRDKKTGNKRGAAFIKFERQSEAAKAKEECDPKYGARWADVRVLDPSKQPMKRQMDQGAMGGFDMGGGGMGGGGMGGMSGGMGGMSGGMSGMSGGMGGMGPSFGSRGGGGTNVVEALVPNAITQEQVYRLFDIVPGLQNCTINPMTGMATIVYNSPDYAAHAKEKIDGFDIFGSPIAVRYARGGAMGGAGVGDTNSQLQNALQTLKNAGAGNMQALVQSLQQVTQVISSGGGGGGGGMSDEDISMWCPKTLPARKPLADPATDVVTKVFILSMPGPRLPSDEALENVCCRFGDLISVKWLPNKRYGFAQYASSAAANEAVKELNGIFIMDNQLKVELASGSGSQDKDGPNTKKPRWF